MILRPIKTHKITPPTKENIFTVLDRYLPKLKDRSIVAITSKVIAICENRVVRVGEIDKNELVKEEVEYFFPKEENKYHFFITIKDGILIASGGIDESNGNGYYILWPKNPQGSANEIRRYLRSKHQIRNLGVIITDSKTTPLRRGVTGVAIAHSGFAALNNYVGEKDIFGRQLNVTKANISDGLAAAVVMVMGEGSEQTPLVVIEDVPFVTFQDHDPTDQELEELKIPITEDIYSFMLTKIPWRKGKKITKV